MHKFILSFFLVLILPGLLPVLAQKGDFSFPLFQRLSTKDGLSNNQAYALLVDSRGFIWVTTNYGLNRYDGYNFKIYNYDAMDTNSLSPSWYWSIMEDKRGFIWMTTTTQGIFSLDPMTEKFTRYYHQPGNNNSLSGEIGNGNMVMDSSGTIWICTLNGLNSFDPVRNKFEHFFHRANDTTTLSSNLIYWLCTDDENNLWIMADNTIDVFSISEKKVIARYAIGCPQMPGDLKNPGLSLVQKGLHGNIWIGTYGNGLYRYNSRNNTWKHFFKQPGNPYSLKDSSIFALYEEPSGNFFVSPNTHGIYYCDTASGRFFYSAMEESGRGEAVITNIHADKSGKVWMTCYNNGVFTFNPPSKKITTIRKSPENAIQNDGFVGFYRSKKNELLVTAKNGIYIFDKDKKSVAPFKLTHDKNGLLDNNWNWMIRQDKQDVYWIVTVDGLISFDAKTKIHHYYYNPDGSDSTGPGYSFTTGFSLDNSGRYWITSFGAGLNLFNPETGKYKSYKVHSGKNSISSNYLGGIFKDSKGMLYLGTWYGGLAQFNPETESFKTYRHSLSDPHSISNDITWPLYEDARGIIWIGTIGGGLNAFDPKTGKFRAFTMQDGLPSNAVVSLVNDDAGRTWLGTYGGISCFTMPENPFDKNTKINFRNYDMDDGLPSNDLYFFGAYKDPDGTLFFATNTTGFFYFDPHTWKDNDYVPPVYITDFRLMNKPVQVHDSESVLTTPIEFTREIFLNYKQNIISFTFAALNHIHPEKNRYAYQLKGYDKDWIFTDASKRFATYTNLDPGDYTFRVKGSNNDGVWNTVPAEILIHIRPPFWQTAWFKLLLALFIFGTAYAFYRYRIGQILLLQRIRNKIAADLHDDIGSTLNSISVYSEVAKKDSSRQQHALNMIGESSRKIIDSLSDIVWSINPENDNFDKILLRMRTLSYNMLKAKKIGCTFHADDSLGDLKLPMEIRRNFYLIFKESLNNLVKYSQANRAYVGVSIENKRVTLILRDDGVGFDSATTHNGNGLNNMRRRAQEINASLHIESSEGKGTSIELNLPI